MTVADYLSRLAVALPLVLLLLAGLWLAAKRGWIVPPASGNAGLRAVATLAMGPGARLVVVEFDGERLLVAAGRGGLTILDRHPRAGGDPSPQPVGLTGPRLRRDDGLCVEPRP